MQVGHGDALDHLRVEEQFGALPESVSQEEGRRQRVASLALGEEAVGAVVGGRKCGMHLPDIGRLEIHAPILGAQGPRQPGRTSIDLDGGGSRGAGLRDGGLGPGRRRQAHRAHPEGERELG